LTLQAEPSSARLPHPDKDIYARTKDLIARKNLRIEQAQKLKEELLTKELKDHGFTPKINDYSSVRRTIDDLISGKKNNDSKNELPKNHTHMSASFNHDIANTFTRSAVVNTSNVMQGMRTFAKKSIQKKSMPKQNVTSTAKANQSKVSKTSKPQTAFQAEYSKPPLNFFSSFNLTNWSSCNPHIHDEPAKESANEWENDGYMPFADFLHSIRPTFNVDRNTSLILKRQSYPGRNLSVSLPKSIGTMKPERAYLLSQRERR